MNSNSRSGAARPAAGRGGRDAAPSLRERVRAETTRAVLGAAETVFAAQGLRAARMEDIAARAGVAVGTVYNHFEDREALLQALLATRRTELVEKLDAALEAGSGQPFPALLELFTRAVLDHFESHRAFFTIIMEGEHERGLAGAGRPSGTMLEVQQRVEHLIARGLRKKALRSGDLWPAIFMGAVKSVMVHSLNDTARARPLGERAPELVRFFLEGAGA